MHAMDDDNLVDVNFTDLDLNQEPTDPPMRHVPRFGSLLNELESTHDRIEERIRQLEAVTARARQRQRWRQARNSMEISSLSGERVNLDGERGAVEENAITLSPVVRTPDRGCKRDSSHLVAKALEMDANVKKTDKDGGSFYDCNICLELAKDPVLTCCGHLFCWPCFYQVSFVDSTTKECPVCKGEVSNTTVIPIYGNGDGEHVYEAESGLKIPPRPKAHRVESLRQQRLSNGLSHVPVAEALRRIRISIGAMGDQTQLQEGGSGVISFDTESQAGQNAEANGSRRIRIHQVSRVLSESAASLSSLSSALSNAERLVEDLESVINNRFLRHDPRVSSVDRGNPFASNSSALQSNNQPPASTPDMHAASILPQPSDASAAVVRIRRTRASGELTLPDLPSVSLRRRSMSRTSDTDNRDTRESRRRRLN